MTPLFKKLNWKNQKVLLALNAPETLKPELEAMGEFANIYDNPQNIEGLGFAIAFCTNQKQVDEAADEIVKRLEGDAVLWFCYPKASSNRYQCDFNRDTGWAVLGKYGFEPVRQVAIDEDWSALRFRRVDFIKNITRRESFALSEQAKKRTSQKGL